MILVRTSKTVARFSRRALLGRLGASAAFLPLLGAERALGAGADGFPKRLVTIVFPHGVAQPNFYPTGDDPTASDILKSLAPWKSKVTVPAGLDLNVMLDDKRRYDGHFSYPALFTGTYRNVRGQVCTSTGPSIDQVVSNAIAAKVNLPVPLMNIAVEADTNTSFRGPDQRNTAETDPRRMFTTLFSGRTMPPAQVDALRNRRASVLDFIGKELTPYCARLGTEDRSKCEAHHESIRMLEKQLASTSGGGGAACTPMMPGAAGDFAAKVKAFVDLAGMALRCDVTRVVSMTWGANGGYSPSTWASIGVPGDYHNAIAHGGPPQYAGKTKIDAWYFAQVASLAKQLDEAVEGTRTALDNSVVCVASDMSEGSRHDIGGGIPFVLVGSAGGAFKTGRVIKLGSWNKAGQYWVNANNGGGVPHNRLLASLVNAMDVPVQGFGAPAYGGLLSELQA